MQGKEQQECREGIETMIASGRLTEDDARKIYVMGADAVAFAILALQTKKQVQDKEEDRHEGSDKQSAPWKPIASRRLRRKLNPASFIFEKK